MKNFHPSHWVWLLAITVSLPQVALAATMPKSVSCGTNFNCLIKKAAACQPATGTVVFSGRHPLFSAFFGPEFRAKIVTQYTIKGRRGANCLFNSKNMETVGSYTKTGRAQLLATGKTDQEIDVDLTSFNNSYVEGNANTPDGQQCVARVKSNLVKFLRLAKTGQGDFYSSCKADLSGVSKCDLGNGITCEQKSIAKPSVINDDGTKTPLQENPDGSYIINPQSKIATPTISIVPISPTPGSIVKELINSEYLFNNPSKKEADGLETNEKNGVLGVFQLTNKGNIPVYIQTLLIENIGAHKTYNSSSKTATFYFDNCIPFDRRFPNSRGTNNSGSGYTKEYTFGYANQVKPGECQTLVVYWNGIDYRPKEILPNGDTRPLLTKVLSTSGDTVTLRATGGTYMLRATDMEKDFGAQKAPAPGTSIPFTADATVGTLTNP